MKYLLFFFLGLVLSFSLAPYNLLSLCFIIFPLILYLKKINQGDDPKCFFAYGFLFAFGYFVFSLYWISYSLNFDPAVSILKPFAILGLPFCLSLFYGLCFYILKKFFRFGNFYILYFAMLLSLTEFLRSYLTGFSWNLFVYALNDNLQSLQILNLVGTYGLNFLAIIIFSFPFLFFCENKRKSLFRILIFTLIVSLNFLYGHLRLETVLSKKKQDILIVQPNENLVEIFNYPNDYISNLIRISEPHKQESNAIFLWPEGTFQLNNKKNFSQLIKKNFKNNQKVILGGNLKVENNIYNAFLVFDSNGELIDQYRKIHLVPFGEFIPYENILQFLNLKKVTFGYQSFSRGKKRNIMTINSNNILPLICYEVIDTGDINLNNDQYDLILNISEDGWFNKSIGAHQHFVHSIFRSIEEGKHSFRSTNQGISSSINPLGQVIYKSELNKQSMFVDVYYLLKSKTVFSIMGNTMFFFLILLSALICLFSKRYFKV